MHFVEPHFGWRGYYTAEDDPQSPFYGRVYSEFEFEHRIYNYVIHPQWDTIGSETLFIKILFIDYQDGYSIIELIGEWNDAIENDIMTLKRDIIDTLIHEGINKFILVGENVLNFHSSDDSYYEEWIDDIEDGWVVLVNFHDHVSREMQHANIDQYFLMGGQLDDVEWRTFLPHQFFRFISKIVNQRLD
ncbi:MAG: hypothetical protein KF704_06180 [Crocinitomicaceae bacterium]|nr:hypothetical protein [Crocinitomicaceae bacterium]NGF75835.1 hypothetical protein [Fluviicola sp. SGL-29]